MAGATLLRFPRMPGEETQRMMTASGVDRGLEASDPGIAPSLKGALA